MEAMKGTLGAIVVAVALAGIAVARAEIVVAGQAPDPKLAAQGKKLYTTYKCDKCHTIAGRGTKKPNGALDSVGAKLSAADIKKWLTATAEMEAKLEKPPKEADSMTKALKTKGIEPGEVDSLVAYLRTLTKK
jgi:mono/diheme cytochrome c family protein